MSNLSQKKIRAFLKNQYLAVIATTDLLNKYPESALIAFVEDEGLTLFFQTNKYSRKAHNLRKNASISLVIGLAINDLKTVQYQVTAEQFVKPESIEKCKRMFIAKRSPTAKPEYLNHPHAIFFQTRPTWIGFHDYSGKKTIVEEIQKF